MFHGAPREIYAHVCLFLCCLALACVGCRRTQRLAQSDDLCNVWLETPPAHTRVDSPTLAAVQSGDLTKAEHFLGYLRMYKPDTRRITLQPVAAFQLPVPHKSFSEKLKLKHSSQHVLARISGRFPGDEVGCGLNPCALLSCHSRALSAEKTNRHWLACQGQTLVISPDLQARGLDRRSPAPCWTRVPSCHSLVRKSLLTLSCMHRRHTSPAAVQTHSLSEARLAVGVRRSVVVCRPDLAANRCDPPKRNTHFIRAAFVRRFSCLSQLSALSPCTHQRQQAPQLCMLCLLYTSPSPRD